MSTCVYLSLRGQEKRNKEAEVAAICCGFCECLAEYPSLGEKMGSSHLLNKGLPLGKRLPLL